MFDKTQVCICEARMLVIVIFDYNIKSLLPVQKLKNLLMDEGA